MAILCQKRRSPFECDRGARTGEAGTAPLRPIFRSDWLRSLFIHYEVEPAALQPQVPFELDLFGGRAYVSLVAFTMARLRPAIGGRMTAWAVSPIATHPFLNVRTYVRHAGEPG